MYGKFVTSQAASFSRADIRPVGPFGGSTDLLVHRNKIEINQTPTESKKLRAFLPNCRRRRDRYRTLLSPKESDVELFGLLYLKEIIELQ